MSFINRNANLILLALIVIAAIALTGATVFFQKNFENVNSRYNEKLSELNNITTQLKNYKQVLDQTKDEISLLRLRDEDFTEKFTNVKDQKEDLQQDRTKLEIEKGALQQDLAEELRQHQETKKDLTTVREQLSDKAQELAGLRAQVKQLKSKKRALEIILEDNGIAY